MNSYLRRKFPLPLVVLVSVLGVVALSSESFPLAKSIHLIAVISWFAGLFYLPRLFVYQVESDSSEVEHTLSIMSWKLYYYIMNPAAIVSIISACWMLNLWSWNIPLWLHLKLSLVGVLLCFHMYCGRCLHKIQDQSNQHSGKFYRILNEVPTLLLIMIIALVVYKPDFG